MAAGRATDLTTLGLVRLPTGEAEVLDSSLAGQTLFCRAVVGGAMLGEADCEAA